MSRNGYIKLYRSIKDNFLWKEKPFTKGQAWTDILLEANHKDGGYFKRGVWVDVKRGQDGRSELTLSSEWGWSRGKVRRFLETLRKEQMIELKQDNKTTIITICNYEHYQGNENLNGTADRTTDGTPNGHQTDTKQDTNNNVKNVNKKEYVEDSNEFRLALYLFNHIKKNKPDYKKPNLQNWAKDADLMLRVDGREIEKTKSIIQWVQNDDFEKTNVLSISKLRKRFDNLEMKMNQTSIKKKTDNGSLEAQKEYEQTLMELESD